MLVAKYYAKSGNVFVEIEVIVCQELVKNQLKYPLVSSA